MKRTFIDCPVCYSGNGFSLEPPFQEFTCDDCSFVLARVPEIKAINFGRCVFCGSENFFLDAPFSLAFLGTYTVCYVCEAEYRGLEMNNPDRKYNEEFANSLKNSEAALNLKERVERYGNQLAG